MAVKPVKKSKKMIEKVINKMIIVALLLTFCTFKEVQAAPQIKHGINKEISMATEIQTTATEGKIKVAILAPLSGDVSFFGDPTVNGALTAIDEWNVKGGVLGKKIEAVVEDTQGTSSAGVKAATKVIKADKVHYIIGDVVSYVSIPVSKIAQANKVIQISPTSTDTLVTTNPNGSTKAYIFRACVIDPFQGMIMAKFALQQGYKTAFILINKDTTYSSVLAKNYEKTLIDNGGAVVGKQTYSSSKKNFSDIIAKVEASNAEVVYIPDFPYIVNLIAAQIKEKGIYVILMGGDGWSGLDKKAAEGGFYSDHYSPDDPRPIVQDFVKRWKGKFGSVPDVITALAYDATNLLLTAIEKAGVDDTSKVKDVLAALQFKAVSGDITFDKFHNPIKNAVVMQVKNGQTVFITSVAP
jgi:branched-chain amino acid transport system substrate-binding protein